MFIVFPFHSEMLTAISKGDLMLLLYLFEGNVKLLIVLKM